MRFLGRNCLVITMDHLLTNIGLRSTSESEVSGAGGGGGS